MKKLLYLCLAVAFIFTACSKRGDTPQPIPSIVGVWTLTSVAEQENWAGYDVDDNLEYSGDTSYTSTPNDPDWEASTIEFTADGDMKEDGEVIGTYTYSDSILLIVVEDGEVIIMTSCTVTARTFTGTRSETEVEDEVGGGYTETEATSFFTYSRNTSGLTNTTVNQRKGNSSWFNKSNLLKNIKR